jgi:predicted dehydrogenase
VSRNRERLSRRRFLSASSRSGAAIAAAAPQIARAQSANNKVVLALIGAGGRGTALARGFARVENAEFKYVCEANDARGGELVNELDKIRGLRPQRVRDMRQVFDDKDVNGVIVATPEHWHALATIWACQAGKDVYVEKNISLFIPEGRKMIEAARKYNRVVQCGTQNRSGPYALTAREYIRSGKLGKVLHVKGFNLLAMNTDPWRPQPDAPVPAGLDWDSWLGPAPAVPYNPGRHRGWYWYWDYNGGTFSGDGSHVLDLCRIALDDPPHPKAVYCAGGRYLHDDRREMPDFQNIVFDYGNFVMTCESGNANPYMKKFDKDVRYGSKWPYWPLSSCRIEIYGSRQLMYLGRHGCGWQIMEADGKVVAEEKGYFPDQKHQQNFVDCIRSRKRPNGDIEQGHYSATLIQLGNIAYRTGNQRLEFDAGREIFSNHATANEYLKPIGRGRFRIPDTV